MSGAGGRGGWYHAAVQEADRRPAQGVRVGQRERRLHADVAARVQYADHARGVDVGQLVGVGVVADDRQARGGAHRLRRRFAQHVFAAALLVQDDDQQFAFSADGTHIMWQGMNLARLLPGADVLSPRPLVLDNPLLDNAQRERIRNRLQTWLGQVVREHLAPLFAVQAAVATTPELRGIVHRLLEGAGIAPLHRGERLAPEMLGRLRRLGVRVGHYTLFMPAILKERPLQLRGWLVAISLNMPCPTLPAMSRITLPPDALPPAVLARTREQVETALDPASGESLVLFTNSENGPAAYKQVLRAFMGPGDYPERKSYFDYDDSQKAGSVGGKRVHMVMPRSVTLHDYRRREDGLRHHRAMVTIPPKLRENIAKLFGFDDSEDAGSEVALTTAMVALADYAAASLIKDKTLLIVSSPVDEHAEDRKAARVAVRNLGISKNGKIY